MKKTILERVLRLHRIHHPTHSFGWAWPWLGVARFDRYGWRRVSKHSYHDCTKSGGN